LLGSYEPAHAAESSPLAGFGQAQRTSCLMHSCCVACVGSLLPIGQSDREAPTDQSGALQGQVTWRKLASERDLWATGP
jgi:hypothetical protein